MHGGAMPHMRTWRGSQKIPSSKSLPPSVEASMVVADNTGGIEEVATRGDWA